MSLVLIWLTAASPETAMSFTPDLIIISQRFLPEDQYENLSKVAPVYVLKDAYADWRQTLRTIASLVGKSELADLKCSS
jgi:iron complex transport system substrate-binding protein